jgi:phenylacetate-CoA ligase
MAESPASPASFYQTSLDEHFAARRGRDAAGEALALFRRVAERVPAYRVFLAEHGVAPADVTLDAFASLPLITKDDYLRRFSLAELCWDGTLGSCDTIALSSGSTGEATYFPRSAEHELAVSWRFEQVFRDAFKAHERRTLAVVCFPLGTWVGGMYTQACCRHLARKGYPLLVVTPGNQPADILRNVRELGPLYQQVVLLGYPPFIKDVIDAGRASGCDWSRYSLRLVLAGEVFSEAWRDIVIERAGLGSLYDTSAALYGTADAGVLGNETPLSVAIRRFAAERDDVAEQLFGQRRLPTLVQYDPCDRYFEQLEDALVFSGEGGGIPLVRYRIGDTGGVIPFGAMMSKVAQLGFDGRAAAAVAPERALPFVYVFGRAHHALSFYGANVFMETVRLGLEQPQVRAHVSGKFVMEIAEDSDHNRELALDVELARGLAPARELADSIADQVRDALLGASSEYGGYVPAARQRPRVRLWPHGDPAHFPAGVKHRYLR